MNSSTRRPGAWGGLLLVCAAMALTLAGAPAYAQSPGEVAASDVDSDTGGLLAQADTPPGGGASEAQRLFREGAELYRRNAYREALSQFNRALALDPNLEEAKAFRQKCEEKLQLAAQGQAPDQVPGFETIDPESLVPEGPQGATPLSAEEQKIQRVRELMDLAAQYLEYQMYSKALQLYREVLLIAPDNEKAQQGLHQATLGANRQQREKTAGKVLEDRDVIRDYIESSKRLPEGADGRGVKPHRITVPVLEEVRVEERRKSKIEEALDSPIGLTFEDEHIQDIVDFISEYVGINIVLDHRVIEPPRKPVPTGAFPGAVPGAVPGAFPGAAPGAFPGAPAPQFQQRQLTGRRADEEEDTGGPFGSLGGFPQTTTVGGQPVQQIQPVTDGYVPYIRLQDVSLREGLTAMLRSLNLDYSIQPGFLWISTPDRIRFESFEKLETRYYTLRNAGAETLFKIVVLNSGGFGGGGLGGFGGGGLGGFGGGGLGGGGFGGGLGGGLGGGGLGGFSGGGLGGGGLGGFGGGRGGLSGGGFGGTGGFGGGGLGGTGGFGGGGFGGTGGFGGGGLGGGLGGGGFGGGLGGGIGGAQFTNISQLFSNINDTMVGEPPAVIYLTRTGTGFGAAGGQAGEFGGAAGRRGSGLGGGGGLSGGGLGGEGLGGGLGGGFTGGTQFGGGATGGLGSAGGLGGGTGIGTSIAVLDILEKIIPPVIEPHTGAVLSYMDYNPSTNQLIVHNTPTNLENLQRQLADLDVTPKQVRIESKFVTVSVNDRKNKGFTYDINMSDLDNRAREIPGFGIDPATGEVGATRSVDIDRDGNFEEIPFYLKPDGTNVITNTVTDAIMNTVINPLGGNNTLGITITGGKDGDTIGVTLDFLDSLAETEVLSAPAVTTMNRKPAVIADFQTEFFVTNVQNIIQTTDSGTFGGSPTVALSQNLELSQFVFGITLSVTPQISGTDQIRLWLNPQVVTKQGEDRFTTKSVISGQTVEGTIIVPRTSTQSIWTNVIVRSGDTLVLGGLITDTTSRGEEKIPYLAEVPVLGWFFKGKSKTVRQSSLLIFVTTDIIDPTGAKFLDTEETSYVAY